MWPMITRPPTQCQSQRPGNRNRGSYDWTSDDRRPPKNTAEILSVPRVEIEERSSYAGAVIGLPISSEPKK
jgi:hypothetical protein